MYVGGKEVPEVVHGSRLGLKVHQGAVVSLTAGLDEVVNIQGVYVVEEGTILQRLGQGSVVSKVAMGSQGNGTELSKIRGSER